MKVIHCPIYGLFTSIAKSCQWSCNDIHDNHFITYLATINLRSILQPISGIFSTFLNFDPVKSLENSKTYD